MSRAGKGSYGVEENSRGGDETEFLDYAQVGRWVGFVLRSPRRHPVVSLACVALVMGLGYGSLRLLPKTYEVQTVIQALRNPSLPTLTNAGLYRPYEADAPTRAAKETVLRRDNLLALIEHADLLERYQNGRSQAEVLRDEVARLVRGRERTKDEQLELLVSLLEKRLRVDVTEGTVTITLDWPNPTAAYDVVAMASQNFLETRYSTEIAMVRDALSILESHAASTKKKLDEGLEELQAKDRSRRAVALGARRAAAVAASEATAEAQQPPPPVVRKVDLETVRLRNALEAKKRELTSLEDFRQRRLVELQGELMQYQAMYADKHPAVQSLKQNIAVLSGPSPEVDALRTEVAQLERDAMGRDDSGVPVSVAPVRRVGAGVLPEEPEPRYEDPRDEYERGRVRLMFQNYASVLDRIDAARVEIDAAQAAFKYRYGVITPPLLPKRPLRPAPVQVMAASLMGSLLLALLVSVVRDLRSGLVVESWQLEQALEVPVLNQGPP
jgi:uncharacterized protein involved in exopolysaccharide biosynthesis